VNQCVLTALQGMTVDGADVGDSDATVVFTFTAGPQKPQAAISPPSGSAPFTVLSASDACEIKSKCPKEDRAFGRNSYNEPTTPAEKAECVRKAADLQCGPAFLAYVSCVAANEKCGDDGKTDPASDDVCKDLAFSWATCIH
jgi:hypothetical protein